MLHDTLTSLLTFLPFAECKLDPAWLCIVILLDAYNVENLGLQKRNITRFKLQLINGRLQEPTHAYQATLPKH